MPPSRDSIVVSHYQGQNGRNTNLVNRQGEAPGESLKSKHLAVQSSVHQSRQEAHNCWLATPTLHRWKKDVHSITERTDLSGLSREPVKYQLASTGMQEEPLAISELTHFTSMKLSASLQEVCSQRNLSPHALALFAAHQVLKGYGNGSQTVTASFTPRSSDEWDVFPTVASHTYEPYAQILDVVEQGYLFDERHEDSSLETTISPVDMVKSELVDLIVVFHGERSFNMAPNFPLVLHVDVTGGVWHFTLRYASALFDTLVIQSMLSALMNLLSLSTTIGLQMGDIDIVPQEQIEQMNEWNNTDGVYPSKKRLHHLFEEAVEKNENRVALIYNDKRVTYRALNEQANSLAHHLHSTLAIKPEQMIGLFLDKSDMMIATILGIWKSGATSVPIDPNYPDERVKFVLEDTNLGIIVASQRHIQRLKADIITDRHIEVVALEPLLSLLEKKRQESPRTTQNLSNLRLTSKQLAYVTYTSGTTGLPKGIYKEHTSVVNSITDLSSRYDVVGSTDEVILLFSAYVFEPFTRQMLMALTTGNQLAIISDEEKFDPNVLIPYIQEHKVTYLNGTASVLQEFDFTSCPSLQRIVLVGENLTNARYTALRRRFKGRLLNEYGFTESAFVTALKILEPSSTRTDMSLGRPVRNVKCYILDAKLRRVPLGVTGELYIGGLGISRGYMNREELTRQRFLKNPYQTTQEMADEVNGLMYRTGDLARWLPNGEVEYLGRIDFQIKLRGIRIEPGEIEANLAKYPGVRTSIVVCKKLLSMGVETAQDYLVGYFVCDEQVIPEYDILAFLEKKLPRYMIPTRLIQLPQIPVTINGKADLRALPAVEVAVPSLPHLLEKRVDEVDEALAGIWADLLGLASSDVSLEDNFFRFGGHSITCIQLIARVRQRLNMAISLEEVFQTRTLGAMSELLRSRRDAALQNGHTNDDSDDMIVAPEHRQLGSGTREILANSLQQGFVYHYLKTQEAETYVMQSVLNYRAKVDESLYLAAWEHVQRQHPALRLRFEWETDVVQVVKEDSNLPWKTFDYPDIEESEQSQVLSVIKAQDHQEAYDLHKGPLVRLYFVRFGSHRSSCIFSCHHSILDGWSLPLLFEYVHDAYLMLLEGVALSLQEDSSYLLGQNYLQSRREEHIKFWEDEMQKVEQRCDMNVLLNEASRYKVPLATYDQVKKQKQQTVELPNGDEIAKSLQDLSSIGITLHSILQLVWHLVLHSYGGGTHTVTGTTISGRNLPVPDVEKALGLFINTLPLVMDHEYCADKTVLEAIEYMQHQANALNSRSNVELGRLSKDDLKHGLFDTLFVLENYPNFDTAKRGKQQEALQYEIQNGTEKLSYPLAVVAKEVGDKCLFTLCYASELFTEDTVADLLRTVCDAYRNILGSLRAPIQEIEFLSTIQLDQLNDWNNTGNEFPNGTLHSLFESEAQQKPTKVAVTYENTSLTYRELNERANAMAHHLLSMTPVKPNNIIGLVMEKSEHMITSILAVWKTGGAYVPIDPKYPDERIKFILDDTAALAVIADTKYLNRLATITKNTTPLIASDHALRLAPSPVHPISYSTPTDLAYVMYTSGTTGKPKGVMVEHHGVVNLAASLAEIFGLRATDNEVILSFSNYVFDHFVEQMTDALLNGQTLLVLNDDMRGDKERLYAYIEVNRVTYLSGTPSVISMYEFGRFKSHLRRIDCVGEAFSEPVFDKIRETFSGLIINGYGPTEVSITTHKRLYPNPERRTNKSIGKQVANSTSYVLNENMKRVPIGAVGELYLGGDGVARGYHNRPDLTSERFPANPFQTPQEKREGRNGRLYKTGDLVRWIQNSEGEVEYLGRNDFQVKIRGQRIELGEIEAVLSSYPEIEKSVVLARDRESDGQKYLIGYYVSSASPNPQAIRRFMQSRLPTHMVPLRLVAMTKFPVTVSGKLDSKALPVPDESTEDAIVPPRTEVEKVLAAIWADLLELPLESIGIHNDFFSLGGDSLKSTRLSFAATRALGVSVGVNTLFSHPTVETLAHWIANGSKDVQDVVPLPEAALTSIPLSPAQERLVFLKEFNDHGDAYNISFHFKLYNNVCLVSLDAALRDVVARHEALRTLLTYSPHASQHVQTILDAQDARKLLTVQHVDVATEQDLCFEAAQSAQRVFSLDTELPVYVRLYQLRRGGGAEAAREVHASFVFHHSAFDAWSWNVFKKDLQVCYILQTGLVKATPVAPLKVQYKEYAVDHLRSLSSARSESLQNFWSQKLSGYEPLRLITDSPRPPQFDYAGRDIEFELDGRTVEKLKSLAKTEAVSLNSILLSAYYLLLSTYTNQSDIVVGVPMAHRTHPEFESVVGFFVNLVPLRLKAEQTTVRELISLVQKELISAQLHQDLPFQEITKILHVEHDPSRHPIVQAIFNWEAGAHGYAQSAEEDFLFPEAQPVLPLPSVAKFDLNVSVRESRSSLVVNFNYAKSLFADKTIQGYIDTYKQLLHQLADATPAAQIASLPITEDNIPHCKTAHLSSERGNDINSLAQLFEHWATHAPDAIAVADGEKRISYGELNQAANRLARQIQTCTVIEKDSRVALMFEKSIGMIVAMLAVWKAGAAYVPLDPSYPAQRTTTILEDTKAKILLTTENLSSSLRPSGIQVIAVDTPETSHEIQSQSPANLSHSSHNPSSLAYVIFTSGTTGKPKGVMVKQSGVLALRDSLLGRYFKDSQGSEGILFTSNYVFDFSIEQLVLSILSGNKLVIPSGEGLTHESFYQLANVERVTYISGTPSVLQHVDFAKVGHLKMVTVAGEEFQKSQYHRIRSKFRGPINNAYGVTETTVYNIVTTFQDDAPFTRLLCDELPGTEVFVLNDRMQRVPVNAVGELYLAGTCLARGYLNQDALTDARFIPNPFCVHPAEVSCPYQKLYKTGDLVCYRGRQKLEYLGRRDEQVKIRGFRVELAEVKAAMLAIGGVRDAVVVPKSENGSDGMSSTSLFGFYALDEGTSLHPATLREALSEALPPYMIPQVLHRLTSSIPVTINGKINTAQLLSMADTNGTTRYAPPRNTVEVGLCQLWASVLNLSHCGIDDDLFAHGGDSISSLQLVGDIYRRLGVRVTVKDIFVHRTVRHLCDNAIRSDNSAISLLPPLNAEQGLVTGTAPLLPIQEWFMQKPLQRRDFWNHCFTIRAPLLDIARLQIAVRCLYERHDILRVQITQKEGKLVQDFSSHDAAVPEVRVLDARDYKSEDDMTRALRDLQSTFVLGRGPLFAIACVHDIEDGSSRLFVALHHMIVDTVSWGIILSDLEVLYNGGSLGMKSSSVQQWSHALQAYSMSSGEREYWNDLRDKSAAFNMELPFSMGNMVHVKLDLSPDETSQLLHQCCSRLQVSMQEIILVALGQSLQKVTDTTLTMVTLEGHGREDSVDPSLDLSRTVGWFTSMYPFAIPQARDPILGVSAVKKSLDAIPSHGIGYGPSHGYAPASLPRVSLNYLGILENKKRGSASWALDFEDDKYPRGLVTSNEDADKSSSLADFTLSVVHGRLRMELDSFWALETAQDLLNTMKDSLHNLTQQTMELATPTSHQVSATADFTPYFAFEGGSRRGTPLFLLPPGEGGAESYFHNIVLRLGDRNIIAFNNHYRHNKSLSIFEDLAEYYLSHMRTIQPEGPYHILGWSFGGILALEMARRLADEGRQLGTIALVDPYFDIPSATRKLGHGDETILDPIYYRYRPEPRGFSAVEAAVDRVLLFKASEKDERHGTALQRQLYDFYCDSPLNLLDTYVREEVVEVVSLKGTHFSWVHEPEQVQMMCELLKKSLERS